MPPIPQGDYKDYVRAKIAASGMKEWNLDDPHRLAEAEISFRILDLMADRLREVKDADDGYGSYRCSALVDGIIQALATVTVTFGITAASVTGEFNRRMGGRVVNISFGGGKSDG